MYRRNGLVAVEASSTLPREEEEVRRGSYAAAEIVVATVGMVLDGRKNSKGRVQLATPMYEAGEFN
jgi:hypothetical protein